MLEKIRSSVNHLVNTKALRDADEVYLFVTLEMAVGLMAFLHAGYVVLYAAGGIPRMAWGNVLCLAIAIVAMTLVRSGRYYYAAGTLLMVQALVYGTWSHFLTGFNTLNVMYLVPGVALVVLIPYAPTLHRIVPGVLMMASAIATTTIGLNPPGIDSPITGHAAVALAIYNVVGGLFGLAFLLGTVATVQNALAHHTEDKLGDMINKANSDTLTGLYNRRYAHIYFDNLLHTSAGEVWCVAMLDVDNFKRLNDEYGHLAGDKVLATLADIMRQVLRSTDNIFRWGGEEFLLVLKGASLQNATQVLERMLKTIEETDIDAEGHTLHVTATVGVTVLDIKNIQASIDKCDARLYIGKRSGKNKVVSKG